MLELGQEVKEKSAGFSQVKLAKYSVQNIFLTDLSNDTSKRISGAGYVSDSDGYEGSSRHLINRLEELVKTLDEGKKAAYDFKINMEESFPDVYSVRTDAALAITKFLDVIRLYGNRREEIGYENGQNLLVRLCDGTISIDDFNKRSVMKKT